MNADRSRERSPKRMYGCLLVDRLLFSTISFLGNGIVEIQAVPASGLFSAEREALSIYLFGVKFV